MNIYDPVTELKTNLDALEKDVQNIKDELESKERLIKKYAKAIRILEMDGDYDGI